MAIEKRWELAVRAPAQFLREFAEFNPILVQLLYNRNLKTKNAIHSFLKPNYTSGLHDPFKIKDMQKAIDRIFSAIQKKEKILIYGDYDADGITATALLYKTLRFLGAKKLKSYIPHRQKEGYGLNRQSVKKFSQDQINLIITVDCGISNLKQIRYANKLGIDIIVTDHHQVPKTLPQAYAILNVKRASDPYPCKDLAGVGIAFKLATALLQKDTKHTRLEQEVFEKWLLDLVAVGTVADLVPLLDENRTLVKFGLIILNHAKRLGFQKLYKASRLNPRLSPLTTYNIGYQIAPRLNAAGRLIHADAAFELLLTESEKKAEKLAQKLEETNRERQRMTNDVLSQAQAQIGKIEEKKILLAANPQWSAGITGLVAGKLCDQFHRPTLIIERGTKESTGSARSIDSFNITQALESLSDLLIRYGGHKTAAGFTLATKNITLFYQKLEKIVAQKLKDDDLQQDIFIDATVHLDQINWPLYQTLEELHPFGTGNPSPRFLAPKVTLLNVRAVGSENQHLKLTLQDQHKKTHEAIGFGMGDWLYKLIAGDKIDIVYELSTNEWNGTKRLEIKIVDLKITEQ